jgi:hypothetical protein
MLARPLWRRALRVKVELRVSEARNNRYVNTLLNGPARGRFFTTLRVPRDEARRIASNIAKLLTRDEASLAFFPPADAGSD